MRADRIRELETVRRDLLERQSVLERILGETAKEHGAASKGSRAAAELSEEQESLEYAIDDLDSVIGILSDLINE